MARGLDMYFRFLQQVRSRCRPSEWKWLHLLTVLAAFGLPIAGQAFLYIVNNTLTETNVVVLDEETYTPIAGSPFLSMATTGQEAIQIAIRPSINGSGMRAYVPGFQTGNVVFVFDIDATTGALTQIPGSPFPNANNPMYPFDQPFGVAIAPDGSIYITNFGAAQTVYKLDRDLNLLASFTTPYSNLATVAVDHSGTNVYIACTGNSRVIRLDSDLTTLLEDVPSGGSNPYVVSIHPNDTYLYATNLSGAITRFDYPDLSNPLTVMPGIMAPIGATPDPDGTRLYIGAASGTDFFVLDATTLALLATVNSQGSFPYIAAINPDGTHLYITNAMSGDLSVRDLVHDTFPPIVGSPFGGFTVPYGMAFTPLLTATVTNLSGKQLKNDFGLLYERFNLLEWGAPISIQVTGYRVYRNGALIAALNADTLQYADHDRKQGISTLYSITFLDANGVESDPVSIQIR